MSVAEFQKLHEELHALRHAGNFEEFAHKFAAKGAVFIGPLHDPLNVDVLGKLAQSEKAAVFKSIQLQVKVDEVTQLGDVVIDRCTLTAKTPAGDKTGWSLTVWVKEDGHWKIRNSSVTFKKDQ